MSGAGVEQIKHKLFAFKVIGFVYAEDSDYAVSYVEDGLTTPRPDTFIEIEQTTAYELPEIEARKVQERQAQDMAAEDAELEYDARREIESGDPEAF